MIKNKKNKYGNKKVYVDGIRFDSKAESKRYMQLKELKAMGLIKNLELQPEYELIPSHKKNGHTVRALKYRADFRYINQDGELVVEDVKGLETDVFKIKKKLTEFFYPDVTITLVR